MQPRGLKSPPGASLPPLSDGSMGVEDFSDEDESTKTGGPVGGGGLGGGGRAGATDASFSLGGTEASVDLDSPPAKSRSPPLPAGKGAATSPAAKSPSAAASPSSATRSLGGVVPAPGLPLGGGREVSISISCRDLPRTKAGNAPVDPIAAAFVQDPRNQHFLFAAQTEWLKDRPNPDFDSLVTLDWHPHKGQIVKFSVYDVSSPSVRDHECIGSVLVRLDDVCTAQRELMYQLLHEDPVKANKIKGAIIILTMEADDDEEDAAPKSKSAAAAITAAAAGPKPAVATSATFSSTGKAGSGSTTSMRTPARGAAVGGLLGSPGESSSEDEEDEAPVKQQRPSATGPGGAFASARPSRMQNSSFGRPSAISDDDEPSVSFESPANKPRFPPAVVPHHSAARSSRATTAFGRRIE